MSKNHFIKMFEAKFNYLWSLFIATDTIKHNGEKGSLREAFVRQIIESLLPHHFAIGSGIITDFNGKESSQADIIIYDKRLIPPIFQDIGRGIYPIDSVLRVLEIKSNLDKKSLIQIKDASWKLNPSNPDGLKIANSGNLPGGQMNYPLYGVFAYKCSISNLNKTLSSLGAATPFPTMAILGKGVCLNKSNTLTTVESNSELTRFFMSLYLECIEEEAASRHHFGLISWLGKSFFTMQPTAT
jgi:hypothetical protein